MSFVTTDRPASPPGPNARLHDPKLNLLVQVGVIIAAGLVFAFSRNTLAAVILLCAVPALMWYLLANGRGKLSRFTVIAPTVVAVVAAATMLAAGAQAGPTPPAAAAPTLPSANAGGWNAATEAPAVPATRPPASLDDRLKDWDSKPEIPAYRAERSPASVFDENDAVLDYVRGVMHDLVEYRQDPTMAEGVMVGPADPALNPLYPSGISERNVPDIEAGGEWKGGPGDNDRHYYGRVWTNDGQYADRWVTFTLYSHHWLVELATTPPSS